MMAKDVKKFKMACPLIGKDKNYKILKTKVSIWELEGHD